MRGGGISGTPYCLPFWRGGGRAGESARAALLLYAVAWRTGYADTCCCVVPACSGSLDPLPKHIVTLARAPSDPALPSPSLGTACRSVAT